MGSQHENWVHIFTSGKISFQLNVVSDISFLGSQWNTRNLSNYESPSNPLMWAPFEPNSINIIIKMKGTEAVFFPCCASCYPKHYAACHCTLPRSPTIPKSKYYFSQMVKCFQTPPSRRYASVWRHLVKPRICLLVSKSFQPLLPSPLLCFWWFASHVTHSNYN